MNLIGIYALCGIGIQVGGLMLMVAAAPFESAPPAWSSHHTTSIDKSTLLPSMRTTSASQTMAFVTRQSSRHVNRGHEVLGKRFPTIDAQSFASRQRLLTQPRATSTCLLMLPEHYEHLSLIEDRGGERSSSSAASMSTNGENAVDTTIDTMDPLCDTDGKDGDDGICTPETFADSSSTKRQVKDAIANAALDAFDSTDFAHEPHLSPELEDAETAYEVALLANAAHELADAAEKENRQSKAAMLERERELEWIQDHDDDNDTGGSGSASGMNTEAFQRSLLAAQLANNGVQGPKKAEAFQRSLLSARIANDAKAKEVIVEQQRKEEWMGSEARAASMGGEEVVSFNVAGAAASSAAAKALADAEAEEHDAEGKNEDANEAMPAVAASIADTAERMILGEDIALVEHTPETQQNESSDTAAQDDVLEGSALSADLFVREDDISQVDQWRMDYVKEIRNYIAEKGGVEPTKERVYGRGGNVDNSRSEDNVPVHSEDDVTEATTTSSKELDVVQKSNTVIRRTSKRGRMRGIIKQLRQRRRFLVVALAVVLGRRLFLAYWGKGTHLF